MDKKIIFFLFVDEVNYKLVLACIFTKNVGFLLMQLVRLSAKVSLFGSFRNV